MPESKLLKELEKLDYLPFWDWSADAADTVIAGLESEDSKERRLAINLAHEIVTDEVAEKLLGILLSDGPDDLRASAAIPFGPALEEYYTMYDLEDDFFDSDEEILSKKRYDETQKTFKQLYHDSETPKLVRRRVLEASVRSPEDWHEGAIRSAYHSDDDEWLLTAVFCMGEVNADFDSEVLEALHHDSLEIRVEAVRAAGNMELSQAAKEILSLAASETEDRDLRVAAIEALPYLQPDGAFEVLEKLEHSKSGEIAEAAEEAMHEFLAFSEINPDDEDFDFDDLPEDDDTD